MVSRKGLQDWLGNVVLNKILKKRTEKKNILILKLRLNVRYWIYNVRWYFDMEADHTHSFTRLGELFFCGFNFIRPLSNIIHENN